MPAIKIQEFGGALPAWDPRLLATGQASYAKNTYVPSGALSGWRKPKLLRTLTDSAARMVFRIPSGTDNSINAASVWLEFVDPDTDVFRSPIVDDEFNRYYFVSPSAAPKYNTYDRIAAASQAWLLGVPPPACAPVLSVTGGGNNLTLGNFAQSGDDATAFENTVYLIPFTTPGATQIQDVQFTLGSNGTTDTTTHWAAVVYDDNAGVPGTLLNTGQVELGINLTNESAFLNPTNLSSQTQYWLGLISDAPISLAGGATASVSFSQPYTNGPPATAPTASADTGFQIWGDFVTSDVLESRAYVYTWLSAYNEEGPPSPPASLDGWTNGTWTVGLWSPASEDLGTDRNLTKINIYRTVPGQGGQTAFFYVTTVDIGTASYVDDNPNNTIAFNDQIQSTTWFPPPENLQGVTVMQNGMVAGFTTNEIWFCEPYRPHAWPPAYVLTVDYPIVGMAVTNGSLVVCTSSLPYVVSGPTPGQMTQSKCSLPNPCSSRASIIGGDAAVTYMSSNGLIQITAAGVATNTTDLWFTREKWQQLVPQKYARAIHMASYYYCFGSVSPPSVSPVDVSLAQTGFTIELDQDNTSFTIWPQPGGHRIGFSLLDSPTGFDVKNLLTDPWTGIGLFVANGGVYYFDFSDPAPETQVYTWKSKLYQQNAKRNYSATKVYFSVPSGTPALNSTRIEADVSDPVWSSLPSDRWGFLKTYVDTAGDGSMVLTDCREIRSSGELLRIVGGYKADTWMFELVARVPISNVQIATSVKELAQV